MDSSKITVNIDSKYHRRQFDDWLAGGWIEFEGKRHYWSAQNNNYGFGWEVEPVTEEDWTDIDEVKYKKVIKLVKSILIKHQSKYETEIN